MNVYGVWVGTGWVWWGKGGGVTLDELWRSFEDAGEEAAVVFVVEAELANVIM